MRRGDLAFGVVGVHGTNSPWLIGQAVSHGCVRLRNSDVLALRRLVRVGTPVSLGHNASAPPRYQRR